MSAPTLFAVSNAGLVDAGLAVLLGIGFVSMLSIAPWFSRRPMAVRLAPYMPTVRTRRTPAASDIGLRETIEPLLTYLGNRLSATLGVVTDLDTRLIRAGREPDSYSFRLRQMLSSLGALATGLVAWAAFSPPTILTLCLIVGAPVLAALGSEQSLARSIQARQQRLTAELPVVIEQLGMLVSSGFSLTSAIAHIAERGSGVVASDLRRVTSEIRRGVAPGDAFQAWADLSGLPSVERLVAILALNSEAADLGSLVSAEAKSVRSEAHRDLVEVIERRSQLVWVPVTVATLVPGLIFLAVPFYSAMAQVTGG